MIIVYGICTSTLRLPTVPPSVLVGVTDADDVTEGNDVTDVTNKQDFIICRQKEKQI